MIPSNGYHPVTGHVGPRKEVTLRIIENSIRTLVILVALAAPGARQARSDEAAALAATPREAMQGYIDACRRGDYAAAAGYLDTGSTDAGAGATLARHLKVVLDKTLWVDFDALSDEPEGVVDDGLAPDLDLVGTIPMARGEARVLLERREADGGMGWWIARSTVRRVPTLYAEFGYGALGEILPEVFFSTRFLEIDLWQWIGLPLGAVLAYFIAWPIAAVGASTARRLARRTRTELDDLLLTLAAQPLRWLIALALFSAGSRLLRLSVPVREVLASAQIAAAAVLVSWLLMRLTDGVAEVLRRRLEAGARPAAVAILPLATKTVKGAMIAFAGIAMLHAFHVNVAGLLAGLGIGGLAVALAAQKSVENLFGGVTLIADQPVRVGDFGKFGDAVGTIEDVGLRSTRIRTLDRTVVTIPNAQFSQTPIENFAVRDRIWLKATLNLRYETAPDQLRYVLAGLRKLLASHPKVHPVPARVRFAGFGASSLDLEIFAYVLTQDFDEFLAVREDVFLRMMDVVQEAGTGFAFPSQTVYFGRDSGLDGERTRRAIDEVERWRHEGDLPFPTFPAETAESFRGTLDYPPAGSRHAHGAPDAGRGGR